MTRGKNGKIIFSEAECRIIIERVGQRMSLLALRKSFGVSEKVMTKALKMLGIKTIAKKAPSPAEEEEIIRFLKEGKSEKEVIAITGFKGKYVHYLARKGNVKGWGKTGQISEADKDRLVKEYKETGNYQKVADSMDLTYPEAKCILDERRVKVVLYKPDPETDEQVRHLMATSSDSYIDMAANIGIGIAGFRSICKRLKIIRAVPLRPPAPMQSGPMIDTMIAKYGEEEGRKRYTVYIARMSSNCIGSGNPMYGKPSPQGAGNGWKGWYKDHYFRSLRELTFMVEATNSNIEWIPGEKTTIKYQIGSKERTYRPDFISEGKMIEIKPLKLHNTPAVQSKAIAGREYCRSRGLEYCIIDVQINSIAILEKLRTGDIKFSRDYELRFYDYLKKHNISSFSSQPVS